MPRHEKIFLSAERRDLLMLNYEVDPACLQKYVPAGTGLDSFHGKTYVRPVGVQVWRTKLLGTIPTPLHTPFQEIHPRFLVPRSQGRGSPPGVSFLTEIPS